LIHDGEQQSPISTFAFMRSFLDDLAMSPPPLVHQNQGQAKKSATWIAPPASFAKLNVDAAVGPASIRTIRRRTTTKLGKISRTYRYTSARDARRNQLAKLLLDRSCDQLASST
jgi:hypothetical protein